MSADVKQMRVMYTKHLTQRTKAWQDGTATINTFGRGTIKSEDGVVVDSFSLQKISIEDLIEGFEFRAEKHLVQIQDNGASSSSIPAVTKSTESSGTNHPKQSLKPRLVRPITKPLHLNQPSAPSVVLTNSSAHTPHQQSAVLRAPSFSNPAFSDQFDLDAPLFPSDEQMNMIPYENVHTTPSSQTPKVVMDRAIFQEATSTRDVGSVLSLINNIQTSDGKGNEFRRIPEVSTGTSPSWAQHIIPTHPEIPVYEGHSFSAQDVSIEDDGGSNPLQRARFRRDVGKDGLSRIKDIENSMNTNIIIAQPRDVQNNPTKVYAKLAGSEGLPKQYNSQKLAAEGNHNQVDVAMSRYLSSITKVILFPSSTDVKAITRLQRKAVIPDYFTNLSQYKTTFLSALHEDLNFALYDIAESFHKVYERLDSKDGGQVDMSKENTPTCSHGKAVLRVVKKAGPNQGKAFYCCPGSKGNNCSLFQWIETGASSSTDSPQKGKGTSLVLPKDPKGKENILRKFGVKYYAGCEFIVKRAFEDTPFQKKPFMKYQKRRNEECHDSEKSREVKFFLKIARKEAYEEYSRDDLWILSGEPSFSSFGDKSGPICMRSAYFGISSQSLVELSPLGNRPHFSHGDVLYAIKATNAASHVSMIDTIQQMTPTSLGILPCLLGTCAHNSVANHPQGHKIGNSLHPRAQSTSKSTSLQLSKAEIDRIVQSELANMNLNEDQQRVVKSCSKWFYPQHYKSTSEGEDCVVLVHGVFGSGKSHLLIALITIICKVLDAAQDRHVRILVAALTNTAVDRVLEGLIDKVPFVRVGNIKKISKIILPHLLAKCTKEAEAEAEKELRELLENSSPSEIPYVQQALDDLKAGRMAQRAQRLKNYRVVGTTCNGSSLPILDDNEFPIVILDECSQSMEPLSLLPINRFKCHKLLAVGDPLQLPPQLAGRSDEDEANDTLEKTLFVRLGKLGHEAILLKTQYRCHHAISNIANKLFYEGKLSNGLTAAQRPPLFDLPPVCFVDITSGTEATGSQNSYYNEAEANHIASFVASLVRSGMEGSRIGVVVLYRAQIQVIADKLASRIGISATGRMSSAMNMLGVQISTVDAFQGAEKDVIIVSICRTSRLGFVESKKRLNVAITRARHHLLMFGRKQVLTSPTWKEALRIVEENAGLMSESDFKKLPVTFNQPIDEDFDTDFRQSSKVMSDLDDQFAVLEEPAQQAGFSDHLDSCLLWEPDELEKKGASIGDIMGLFGVGEGDTQPNVSEDQNDQPTNQLIQSTHAQLHGQAHRPILEPVLVDGTDNAPSSAKRRKYISPEEDDESLLIDFDLS